MENVTEIIQTLAVLTFAGLGFGLVLIGIGNPWLKIIDPQASVYQDILNSVL